MKFANLKLELVLCRMLALCQMLFVMSTCKTYNVTINFKVKGKRNVNIRKFSYFFCLYMYFSSLLSLCFSAYLFFIHRV